MNSKATEILYQGEDYSVVLLPGDALPSLVLSHQFVVNLSVALGLVNKENPSSFADIEPGSFTKLRTALEPAIVNYGHEYIECLPNYPMSLEAKEASIAVRDAFRALKPFHGK